VAIGISHWRPQRAAVRALANPADFAATILIVQHMPEGFTEMFARRLDDAAPSTCMRRGSGDLLIAGRVLIALAIATS